MATNTSYYASGDCSGRPTSGTVSGDITWFYPTKVESDGVTFYEVKPSDDPNILSTERLPLIWNDPSFYLAGINEKTFCKFNRFWTQAQVVAFVKSLRSGGTGGDSCYTKTTAESWVELAAQNPDKFTYVFEASKREAGVAGWLGQLNTQGTAGRLPVYNGSWTLTEAAGSKKYEVFGKPDAATAQYAFIAGDIVPQNSVAHRYPRLLEQMRTMGAAGYQYAERYSAGQYLYARQTGRAATFAVEETILPLNTALAGRLAVWNEMGARGCRFINTGGEHLLPIENSSTGAQRFVANCVQASDKPSVRYEYAVTSYRDISFSERSAYVAAQLKLGYRLVNPDFTIFESSIGSYMLFEKASDRTVRQEFKLNTDDTLEHQYYYDESISLNRQAQLGWAISPRSNLLLTDFYVPLYWLLP